MDKGEADDLPQWASKLKCDLQVEIADESNIRRRALLGQEHRLVAATVALVQTVRNKRWDDLRATIGALVWCLLPSAGTASVGILAIATLFVAVQQARYQGLQAEQAAIQNQLADVQRRVGLMQLVPRLLDQIEQSGNYKLQHKCDASTDVDCWTSQKTYRPPQALSSQLATLTAGLRPYRAVIDTQTQIFCPNELKAEPILVLGAVLQKMAERNLNTRALNISLDQLIQDTKDAYNPANSKILALSPSRIGSAIDSIFPAKLENDTRLSCRELSPERGQILAALVNLRVDLKAIARAGADFTGAELANADLSAARLEGIKVSNSRLINVNFSGAYFERVDLSGSELSGSDFSGSTLSTVEFYDLYVNETFANKTRLGPAAELNPFYGVFQGTVVTILKDIATYKDFCEIFGLSRGKAVPELLSNKIILIETRFPGTSRGIVVNLSGLEPKENLLLSRMEGQSLLKVDALPLPACPAL